MTDVAQKDELANKVKGWLDTQGYPLEMRVARQFQRAKFTVTQGDFYETDDHTWREVDVAARVEIEVGSNDDAKKLRMRLEVVAVCECKSNRQATRPWVVFTDKSNEADPSTQLSATLGNELGSSLMFYHMLNDPRRLLVFHYSRRVV
jgi:hypothetical protein